MNEGFISLANINRNELLFKTEKLFTTNKTVWFCTFMEHFRSICTDIVHLQHKSALLPLSCIEYTMLNINIINRRYIAEIWAYGDMRYLDKAQHKVGEYDLSFLFIYFNELWDKLLAARKMYVGKVTAKEITAFMLQTAHDFYSYALNIIRFAITECIEEKPFIDIVKNDVFKVTVGDYMVRSEPVFTLDKNKDAGKLVKWFAEKLTDEYAFGDYSALDFTGGAFEKLNFRYSHFRHSILNNTALRGSTLLGTSFYKAQMKNCRLENCAIYEADFSYTKLNNACFVNTIAKTGLPDENEWRHVGFLPVSFRGADLTGADFRWANLIGADFRFADLTGADFRWTDMSGTDFSGAVLTNADFTGAVLDNAIFSGDDLPLTDEQKSKIIISKTSEDSHKNTDII